MGNGNNGNSRDDQIKKLSDLIGDVRIAMMTTIEPDGSLRARPMATQESEFDDTLWFFTGEHDPKVDEVQRDHRVNISYSSKDGNIWVSVSGIAEVVRDRQKIDELWKPYLKAWFPKGKDDPELALLKVDVEQAEYWDSSSSTIVHAVGLVKALTTGKPYRPGDNEKLQLTGA